MENNKNNGMAVVQAIVIVIGIVAFIFLMLFVADPTSTEEEAVTVVDTSTVEEEKSEIEVLRYSYNDEITTAILLDNKENVLYGLLKVNGNNAGSEPGEFFMLVDPEGNPYVYDGNTDHIPELMLDKKEKLENDVISYAFSDSIYNIRYAVIFTQNNRWGDCTGNVIVLSDAEGKPSTK